MASVSQAAQTVAVPRRGAARASRTHVCNVGMMLALLGVAMLFIALTSAYIVRTGLDSSSRPIPMPRILWLNTAALLASSFAVERARRTLAGSWLALALALGAAFVAGQLTAWQQLGDVRIYLGTSAHSSFFYVITALHAMHVTGGMAALAWAGVAALRGVRPCVRERWLGVTALYWHFMGGLWVYLLVLLFGWR